MDPRLLRLYNRELELLSSREETSGVPVIVITGYPTVPTAVQALRLAVIDYLIVTKDVHDEVFGKRRCFRCD